MKRRDNFSDTTGGPSVVLYPCRWEFRVNTTPRRALFAAAVVINHGSNNKHQSSQTGLRVQHPRLSPHLFQHQPPIYLGITRPGGHSSPRKPLRNDRSLLFYYPLTGSHCTLVILITTREKTSNTKLPRLLRLRPGGFDLV